jgi:hypothetical protein
MNWVNFLISFLWNVTKTLWGRLLLSLLHGWGNRLKILPSWASVAHTCNPSDSGKIAVWSHNLELLWNWGFPCSVYCVYCMFCYRSQSQVPLYEPYFLPFTLCNTLRHIPLNSASFVASLICVRFLTWLQPSKGSSPLGISYLWRKIWTDISWCGGSIDNLAQGWSFSISRGSWRSQWLLRLQWTSFLKKFNLILFRLGKISLLSEEILGNHLYCRNQRFNYFKKAKKLLPYQLKDLKMENNSEHQAVELGWQSFENGLSLPKSILYWSLVTYNQKVVDMPQWNIIPWKNRMKFCLLQVHGWNWRTSC